MSPSVQSSVLPPQTTHHTPTHDQTELVGILSPNGSSNSSFCRICHDGDGVETLVAPCECSGTLALIHASCLERWLTTSNTDKCEICKHPFPMAREPRTCSEYIEDSGNQFNVRNLVADIICFLLLTPLLVVSTYLCVLGAHQYFLKERWEAVGLLILAIFLLAVYFTWCHVTTKFHMSVWRTWQRANQRVRLTEAIRNRLDGPRPRSRPTQSPTSTTPTNNPDLEALNPGNSEEDAEVDEFNDSDTSRILV